jgi:hypothetical protein
MASASAPEETPATPKEATPAAADAVSADPADPEAAWLNPEAVELRSWGYSLRVPLNWGESPRPPAQSIELYLVHPDSGASIAISRRPARLRRYQEWRAFAQNMVESLKGTLREPRISLEEFRSLNDQIVFLVEHTHQSQGAFYFSKKAAIYAGNEIVMIDFNVPLERQAEIQPAFEAFLRTFALLDKSRSRLEPVAADYIGEYRDPARKIVVPVQRRFQRNDPVGVTGLIARWAYDEKINIALVDHIPPPIELQAYGDYQKTKVLEPKGYKILSAGVERLGKRDVYKLVYIPTEGTRTALFIIKSGRRYYMFHLNSDEFSYPYFEKLGEGIAGDAEFPDS